MNMRRDALCAAAQFILAVEEYAAHGKKNMVATVGKITVLNSASNVIPGSVSCTLDIRNSDVQLLSDAYEIINKLCENICHKRKIYFAWKLIQESDPVVYNEKLRSLLSHSMPQMNWL